MSMIFEDGLSEYSISNNQNDHGRFSWLLNDDIKTENLVVGLDSDNNLFIKSGTWLEGTFHC